MQKNKIVKFCFLFLLCFASPALAGEPALPQQICKEVYYLAWTGAWPLVDIPQKILESKLPVYYGSLCIEQDDNLIAFPADPDFELNYQMNALISSIERTNRIVMDGIRHLASKGTYLERKHDGRLCPAVRRGDAAFSEFLEWKLWYECDYVVFRREYNAFPDLKWKPVFKKLYDYTTDYDIRNTYFQRYIDAEHNPEVLIEYE